TQMTSWALQAAPRPQTDAAAGLTRDRPAAPRPNTVAGPTNGPARAFATSPAKLTRPEIAATKGRVARCAARGTETDSATTTGVQRPMITDQLRAHQTMAPLAKTDRTNPTE